MGNHMLIKTAIAVLITASFAGSAVYYGGQGMPENTAEVELRPQSAPEQGSVAIANALTDETPEVPSETPAETKTEAIPEGVPAPVTTTTTTTITETTTVETTSTDDMLALVSRQAERINTPELRDQAYLDIVNYAVKNENYEAAGTALENIKQVELRDTARSQIAISMAQGGDAERAFEIIDTVEIDQLRDVMRLQVIEALIIPRRLPAQLQQ